MFIALYILRLRRGLALLCCVLVAGPLVAGKSDELATLRTGYAAEKTRISNTYEQQKTNVLAVYRQSVALQMIAAKKAGDLDRYLVLETEKNRLDRESTIRTENAPALETLVAQYQKAMQTATSTRDKASVAALRQYVDRLTTLMQDYTRGDRLEDAKIVREEMREAKTELTFLVADTPDGTPASTTQPASNASPVAASAADDMAKSIAGTWKITWRDMSRESSEVFVFDEDGTFVNQKNPNSKQAGGRWEIRNRQLFIHLADKEVTLNITANLRRMMGHSRQGTPVTAVKIADPAGRERG